MNLSTENILLIGSILLFISLFAGKTIAKFGVPVSVLFLAIGILAGVGKAQLILGIVFFISVTSVIIQGTSLPFIAKRQHPAPPEKAKHRSLADLEPEDSIKSNLTKTIIAANCSATGKQIAEPGLHK